MGNRALDTLPPYMILWTLASTIIGREVQTCICCTYNPVSECNSPLWARIETITHFRSKVRSKQVHWIKGKIFLGCIPGRKQNRYTWHDMYTESFLWFAHSNCYMYLYHVESKLLFRKFAIIIIMVVRCCLVKPGKAAVSTLMKSHPL